MQVTHQADFVSHAVIGGMKTIDFGISDSPEFFHILSSTLYSDQILAVVRETLCNAWDAHIEAGRTDTPVQVTLTDDELIIRDFGTGISDDDMGPIYGVYGSSTKKKNGNVTGGFGLGCKAPFAYTDHFEVISHHAGRKTIYSLSKSSAEVNGKPGIVPIASFPTQETGLQVKMKIQKKDLHRFSMLITKIVANGEMNVVVNGKKCNTIPFSEMTDGFLISQYNPSVDHSQIKIYVRYGQVIYPVEDRAEYNEEYCNILGFLGRLTKERYGESYYIVFQAPAHSISVTPSREALSMQEHTVTTVTKMLTDFVALKNQLALPEAYKTIENAVERNWRAVKPVRLLNRQRTIVLERDKSEIKDTSRFFDVRLALRQSHIHNYPDVKNFFYEDIKLRLKSLIDGQFGNTGLIRSFYAEFVRAFRRDKLREENRWFHQKVLAPLFQELITAKLPVDRLSIAPMYGRREYSGRDGYYKHIPATDYRTTRMEEQLPFLRNIIVITHNREDVQDRVQHFPVIKHWLGEESGYLVFTLPRNSNKIELARTFFKDRGMVVIDLTQYHSWERAPVKIAAAPKRPAKPRAVGLPVLADLLNARGELVADRLDEDPGLVRRVAKPKYVIRLPRSGQVENMTIFAPTHLLNICKIMGDIGVAFSRPMAEKYIANGAVYLEDATAKVVLSQMMTNKAIHNYLCYFNEDAGDFYDLIAEDPVLSKKFKIKNRISGDNLIYFNLWRHLSICSRYKVTDFSKEIADVKKLIGGIIQHPDNRALIDLIDSSGMTGYIMAGSIKYKLRYSTDEACKTKLRKLIITALAA